MPANSKIINLIEIGNQLALSAKGLHKKIEENNGQAINVPASMIATKIPDLKVLGENPIFRLKKTEDGYKADTAGVWLNNDGESNLYYSDFEIMEGFTPIRYKTGINGWVEIKHKSGLELKISISTNDDHILELSSQESEGIEGEGMPNPAYLRLIPQPETPLYSSELPHNIEFTIISNGKFSRKYNTPLVTIKSESGKVFKDVICNAALQRIYKEYGQGAKFKIASKHPKRNKQGEPVTANGEVSQTNHAWIVNILDCQLVDFSDL
ncbi:MAG: hypothetical protein KME22_07690 [Hassallia sp. WJT32-NPBG1]|jgi:hypothetical protein|nr:hypothetical protein [Hassallia sp. WJT32-NPBG1]